MNKKAVYAACFDPITYRHEAIINAASKMFDLTIVIANNNSKKQSMFEYHEKLLLLKESCGTEVKVDRLLNNELLANYCSQNNINIIVRGLCNINDLEYELQIASVNADQCSAQTIFIPAPMNLGHISSSMVKEVARLGGSVSKYVNLHVQKALIKKITA